MDGGEIRGAGNAWICPEVCWYFFPSPITRLREHLFFIGLSSYSITFLRYHVDMMEHASPLCFIYFVLICLFTIRSELQSLVD